MSSLNIGLAVTFALLYNITLNISKGAQKYGIDGLSKEILKQWRQRPELKRKFIFWTVGSFGTIFAVIFQLLAQPHAPNSSFVAAFGGIGLLSLLIFSYYVLHEQIKRPEIIGAFIVIVATLIFGITAPDSPSQAINYLNLGIILLVSIGIFIVLAKWSSRREYKGHAIIWGAIAGFFAGLSIALTQLAAINSDRQFGGMFLTADVWLALITGQVAFWGTQYGFKHGQASIVVTLYNTFMIAIPVVIDIIVLGNHIPTLQIAMLCMIAIGVILLTSFRDREKAIQKDEMVSHQLSESPTEIYFSPKS